MTKICVNVALYGSLARLRGGKHIAHFDMEVDPPTTKNDLIEMLDVPENERGYLFINAVLHDVPGLTTVSTTPLKDGDHIGIFSTDHMWPYQYRDGVIMSPELKAALAELGEMHHTYENRPGD
jgi:hypothetical protein